MTTAGSGSTGVDRVATVDGLRTHYRETGDAAAAPVVVLHGIMGHSREWDVLVERLAPRFRVLSVDLRGHGETAWASAYTAAAMAADVIGLLEQLGIGPARLIGHSMGGMVGMLLAAARPSLVHQLVVVDAGPRTLLEPAAADLPGVLRSMALARYPSIDDALAEWLGADPFARAALLRHYLEHCLVPADDGDLRYRFDAEGLVQFLEGGVEESELQDAAAQITCPTLVVRGEHSPMLTEAAAHDLVQLLPRGELVVIPDAAHDLGVERPEAVADAALAFFDDRPIDLR